MGCLSFCASSEVIVRLTNMTNCSYFCQSASIECARIFAYFPRPRKPHMKIHEYQAKDILRKYGVPVPDGEMATTLEEADKAAKTLFGKGNVAVVVKAQIHAGGRGKGGGVKVTRRSRTRMRRRRRSSGMQLVTHQTGPAGQKVQRLLIEAGSAIDRELYLGLVLDRATREGRVHGVAVGRHGDRAGGARHAGADLQGVH